MAVLSGQTADAAAKQFAVLFEGEQSVPRLAEAMRGLRDMAREGAAEIEYTKLQIITTLAIAAVEIAYALHMVWETFGASWHWVAATEVTTIAAIRRAVAKAAQRLQEALAELATKTGIKRAASHAAEEGAEEIVVSGAQETGIQGYQQNA